MSRRFMEIQGNFSVLTNLPSKRGCKESIYKTDATSENKKNALNLPKGIGSQFNDVGNGTLRNHFTVVGAIKDVIISVDMEGWHTPQIPGESTFVERQRLLSEFSKQFETSVIHGFHVCFFSIRKTLKLKQ